MKITIEPTTTVTEVEGRKVRLWQGVTDRGTPCQVYVACVAAVNESAVNAEFEAGLLTADSPPESVVPLWVLAPSAVEKKESQGG